MIYRHTGRGPIATHDSSGDIPAHWPTRSAIHQSGYGGDVTEGPIGIRAFEEEDLEAVVEFSLRAWEPVFASLRSVLGDEVFLRLHPKWQESQAEAVRSSCTNPDRDVFVAVADDRPVAFVAVALNAFHERMAGSTSSASTPTISDAASVRS